MPERSSVAQIAQIGTEVTPGTAVAATRRLGSLTLEPSIQGDANMFRPQGLKFPTTQVLPKEWASVAGSSDVPTYEEILYPLSGAMGAATTVAQVLDGATPTGAYEWTFIPNATAADNPKTFTLENGQAGVTAEQFSHLLFQEFSLDITRAAVSLKTSAFARKATASFTPTPSLAIPATLTPINPATVSVWFADNSTDLGTATGTGVLLNRVISANPSISDRYVPSWFVNGSDPSFTTFVENASGANSEFTLAMEADQAQGMAWLARFRAGTTHYMRIEAKGANIYNAGAQPNLTYLFQWDMAVKVISADAWNDTDGIYGIPWKLQPVFDPTYAKAMQVKVRNKVITL